MARYERGQMDCYDFGQSQVSRMTSYLKNKKQFRAFLIQDRRTYSNVLPNEANRVPVLQRNLR